MERLREAFDSESAALKNIALRKAADEIERLRGAAQETRERGNYEGRHPDDQILWSASDLQDLIDVVAELGIQDSVQTPAEAVRELNAEIERLHAAAKESDEPQETSMDTLTYPSLDGTKMLTLEEAKDELRACGNYPVGAA